MRLVDERQLVAVDALAERRDLDAIGLAAGHVDVEQRPGRQRHALELGHQPGRERGRDREVEPAPARKSSSSALDCCETAIPGSPSTIASSAAATVPE